MPTGGENQAYGLGAVADEDPAVQFRRDYWEAYQRQVSHYRQIPGFQPSEAVIAEAAAVEVFRVWLERHNTTVENLRHDLRNRTEDCDRVRDALLPLYPDEPAQAKVRAGWLAQQWAAPEIERLREQVERHNTELHQLRAERDAFRAQVRDFFTAAYGEDYVYQPPEAYSALEQWLIAVSTGDVEFGARVIGAIRAALSGEDRS